VTTTDRPATTTTLFSPLRVRDVELRNRIGVSPMCQYSSQDGLANEWHLVHLGSRAVGGAALVITEAAAVTPDGRISPEDLGIWDDAHVPGLRRIADFISAQGAVPGVQLAHAGRKASTKRPWDGRGPVTAAEGGWQPVGASPIPFDDGWWEPTEMSARELERLPGRFADGAARAVDAGYAWLEIHAAHGYLLHSFLSPLSNHREDAWGGDLANRARLLLDTIRAVRAQVGEGIPVTVRVSASDWVPGGWTDADTVELAPLLAEAGADLVDCSSGGNSPHQQIEVGPGYQVPFAESVRSTSGLLTAAVGLITAPEHADEIVRHGRADLVLLARELLRDPYWPLHAARRLGHAAAVPDQYTRAFA
jgi:2,4-dienoyl-CoA reductase-like NADH-dependent reductase (Old Yellow Enzyme family)